MRAALQVAAAVVAAVGVWAALNGASPFWTLAAGIAVGGLLVTARRGQGDR